MKGEREEGESTIMITQTISFMGEDWDISG
jgi:hypothetical protein